MPVSKEHLRVSWIISGDPVITIADHSFGDGDVLPGAKSKILRLANVVHSDAHARLRE